MWFVFWEREEVFEEGKVFLVFGLPRGQKTEDVLPQIDEFDFFLQGEVWGYIEGTLLYI